MKQKSWFVVANGTQNSTSDWITVLFDYKRQQSNRSTWRKWDLWTRKTWKISNKLTIKVETYGGIAFAKLILGGHFVFAGILYGHVKDLQRCRVIVSIIFIGLCLKRIRNNGLHVSEILNYTARLQDGISTLWRGPSLTCSELWDHVTLGFGSALIWHSNISFLPSSSWRMAGFFVNVGAVPSICL